MPAFPRRPERAEFVVAAGGVLIATAGIVAGVSGPTWLLWGLLAPGFALFAYSFVAADRREREQLRREWLSSVARYEDNLDAVVQRLQDTERLVSTPVRWRDLAGELGWPAGLQDQPLLDWDAKHGPMDPRMRAFLDVCYSHDRVEGTRFNEARRHMRREVDSWVEWYQQRDYHDLLVQTLGPCINQHAADLAMLAYLEIGQAERVRYQAAPGASWAHLAAQWNALSRTQVAPHHQTDAPTPVATRDPG